jgi:UDP-glucose 4-epimerase
MKWSRKKILITGGAGFIGSTLARRLLNKNADIIVLDNLSYGKKENIPKGCEVVIGDVYNEHTLSLIKGDPDYIFHFAAPSSVVLFNKELKSCVSSTIVGFINIMEFAKERNIKKLVYPSSGSVYGNTSLPQHEKLIPRPVNLYAISKLTCEFIAENYSKTVPNVGLRIFAGYGPGEGHKGSFASVVTLFLLSILKNKLPVLYADGNQSRDFVYIDDVVNAIVSAAEKDIENEIVNIGSGKSHTFNEVIHLINQLLGKQIRPRHVNKPSNYLEKTLADITKMRKLLNIKPLDLESGLEKYIEKIDGFFNG